MFQHRTWSILADLLLLAIVVLYLLVCPYTKVEESFNVQATHDLMRAMKFLHFKPTIPDSDAREQNIDVYGNATRPDYSLHHFDHFAFPGVVPRTFIAPVVISTVAHYVDIAMSHHMGDAEDEWQISPKTTTTTTTTTTSQSSDDHHYDEDDDYWTTPGERQLFLSRLVLGIMSVASQWFLRRSISRKFGHSVGILYTLLMVCQFHLVFYMSRPLPNVFALALVTLAVGYWIRDDYVHMFLLLGATATVFRSEVFALIGPIALVCLVTGKIGLIRGMLTGAIAILYSLDSYFWQRILWPEGEVLFFNTVMNKSHEWGTHPMHWYFTNALPRSMLIAYVLLPLGVYMHRVEKGKPSVLPFALSALAFVALYSILPHKELRFIFYSIPLLNVTAAVGFVSLLHRVGAKWKTLLVWLMAMGLVMSLAVSQIFLLASHHNYFGAYALKRLYAMEIAEQQQQQNPVKQPLRSVHMDSIATMNGVTRFLEVKSDSWRFSKTENNTTRHLVFTHLLTGDPEKHTDFFDVIGVEHGFSRINPRKLMLVDTEPKVFIMARKHGMEENQKDAKNTIDEKYREEQYGNERKQAEFGVGYSHGHGTSTMWINENVFKRLFPHGDDFDAWQRSYLNTLSEYSLPPAAFAKYTTLFLTLVGLLFHVSAIMAEDIRARDTETSRVSDGRKNQ